MREIAAGAITAAEIETFLLGGPPEDKPEPVHALHIAENGKQQACTTDPPMPAEILPLAA